MESYLSGRSPDGDPSSSNEVPQFSAFVEPTEQSSPSVDETVQTLHDEPGGPKVEVISVEGRVTRVLVHLENGKILNLHCEY